MKKNPLIRLAIDSKHQWVWFCCIVVSLMLNGVLLSASAGNFGAAVDYGLHSNMKAMFSSLFAMILLMALNCVRNPLHDWLAANAMERTLRDIRMRMYNAILYAKIPEIEKKTRSGDLMSRASEDMDALCENLETASVYHVRILITAVVALTYCFILSWQLSLLYFFLLPVSLYALGRISAVVEPQQRQASTANGSAMNLAADLLNGLMVIKSYSLENRISKRFADSIDESVSVSRQSYKVNRKMNAVQYIVQIIQTMILFLAGTILVSNGYTTPGQTLAFISVSGSVSNAFSSAPGIINMYRRCVSYTRRIYEILDISPEAGSTDAASYQKSRDTLQFQSVSFAYNGNAVLSKVSFTVRQNQKVGLVGPSGGGKSTALKLISRFYDITDGSITLNGENLGRIPLDHLRGGIALVTQDPCLFDASILENIRMGRPNATESEVFNALEKVGLYGFVQSLEKGIYTEIGEYGSRLSGGQRQRIAIARAILKNAPLVLLDEATSALDNQSEAEVQAALDELLAGRSAVIIAHRLNTLRNADYIICLDKSVIEEGAPDELLARKGYFFQMKQKQMMSEALAHE